MAFDNFFILAVSCLALYFAIKANKKDRWMGSLAITASMGGIAVFIAQLLAAIYPESKTTIRGIANIPIGLIVVISIILALINAIRLRKIPEHRGTMNFVLIVFCITVIFAVVMFTLIQSGVFGE